MTPDQLRLLGLLRAHPGRSEAITAEELGRILSLSPRAIRILIESLIEDHGHGEILAATGDPAGYF